MVVFFIFLFIMALIISALYLKPNNSTFNNKKPTAPKGLLRPVPKSIEIKIYQAFESLHLIYNSSNIDTVEKRLLFLDKIMWDLQSFTHYAAYQKTVYLIFNKYCSDFPDRGVNKDFLSFAVTPLSFLEYSPDYELIRFLAFKRFVEAQEVEIRMLKTAQAKKNRMQKLIEKTEYYNRNYFLLPEHIEWGEDLLKQLNYNSL